ncbi:nucleotidyltransferase [Nitrospira moscoviensis]|uniref:Nucleotidyltransferase n=1 Tax=Nitrospira moscoviensis TaxID=42253 RepID=A0A0K2GFS5_NITMO|nr:nucleotidyltransferase [Nitrospira moscoviensis]ALA59442.1 hypothetical protein NITMOv2_3042 [Nitrospira moscoviensis]
MLIQTKEQLGRVLHYIADSLDMPEQLQEQAVAKYQEVGRWLADTESPLQGNTPDVYPQGSARLGTLTKPVTDRDEYDIDAVALLQVMKQSISQQELKQRIGDRLKQHPEYRVFLEEKRRCWTLNFENGLHVDVLPAIPDEEGLPESILITDRELTRWQHSNPKGYAAWFWSRMKSIFEEERRALAKALQAEVEAVPDWKIKTPLQRAIQLLKRHRDLHFQHDQDDKPASIIITTLAAWAYEGQTNLLDALAGMACTMPDHIESRKGVYWVVNPVNEEENFADKWKEHPQRRHKLLTWLNKVNVDLKTVGDVRGIPEIAQALGASFGSPVTRKAVTRLGDVFTQQRQSGKLWMASGTGTLGATGITKVRNHTFYGGMAKAEKP